MNLYFKIIPDYPSEITAVSSIVRIIDGLGFRYFWATENLTKKDFDFAAGNGSMSINDLNLHIYDLAFFTAESMKCKPINKRDSLNTFEITRTEILNLYELLSKQLRVLTQEELINCSFYSEKYKKEFPFWQLLNGPIADALTHVGQMTSWRRIAGNTQPKVNVFLGNY